MPNTHEVLQHGQSVAAGCGDTIFALSSGRGVAGVSVIRVSGPEAHAVLGDLAGWPLPPARQAAVRTLREPDGHAIDQALVLRFDRGASFTGEDLVELQCHGSRAVVRRMLSLLSGRTGLRRAEPGEFTWRAHRSGRMDVLDVEALGALLGAETEAQRIAAVGQMAGGLRRVAAGWRDALLHAVAMIEVTIDWADEEVPEDVGPEVSARLDEVSSAMRRELARYDASTGLRDGYEVALVGAPNVGKSSLFNYLAGREAAIVSPLPGTTRDVLELRYDLDGRLVRFLDMAGLRQTADPVEAIGVGHAEARARAADLRLFLSEDAATGTPGLWQDGDLAVRTKGDVSGDAAAISVVTGSGIESLLGRIADRLDALSGPVGLLGSDRQRDAVAAAALLVEGARDGPPEVRADGLRRALDRLASLAGAADTEDVYDIVFRNFCLGK